MSQFFPHSAIAEDQPLPHTILTTHVLHRGFQAGTVIGSVIGLGWYLVRRPAQPLSAALLRSAGVGTVVGTGLLAVALVGRMRGKEQIEWADRSWRLLENKGQVEVDNWSLGGAALGAASAYMSPNVLKLGWRGVLGATGLGSLAGVGMYMVYRHGIRGGKWDENEMRVNVTSRRI